MPLDANIQNEANKWLLELQNHKLVVPICLELIKPNQPFFSQFFGIQTLYSKIHSDWESKWSDEYRLNIKNTVFNRFIFDEENNTVFNSKICSCIAAIIIHSIPRLWERSVSDLLNLFHNNQSTDRIKKGALDILSLLPTEFESVVLSNSRRMAIKEEFNSNSENVLLTVSDILEKNLSEQLNILLLKCTKNWLKFGNAKSVQKSNVLYNIFKIIENPEMLVEGLSLIGDLINFFTYVSTISNKEPANAKNFSSSDMVNFEELITPIIRKLVQLKPIYNASIQNQNDNLTICRAFTEVLAQILECYTPIIINIEIPDVQNLLSFLIEVCSHPNREISEITFDAWYNLEIHFSMNEQPPEEPFQKLYAKLLQILIEKSSCPQNIEFLNPTSELADEISNYRSNNECKTWQSYEVVLYIFNCVSKEEDIEDNSIQFQIIQFSLSLPYHQTLSNTILTTLKEYGEFIYETQLLTPAFNFILSMVQHQEIRQVSIKVLLYFAKKYGDRLYNNIQATLQSMESYYDVLTAEETKYFVKTILLLLSYSDYAQSAPVLQRLLNPIVKSINSVLTLNNVGFSEKSELLVKKLTVLKSSLKFPDDAIPIFKEFVVSIWGILNEIHSLSISNSDTNLSESIWRIYSSIILEMGTETVFIDQLFQNLLSTISSFPSMSSSVYKTIDILLNLFGKNQNYQNIFSNLVLNLTKQSLPILSKNNNESIPIITRYYKNIEKVLEVCPNVFYSSGQVVTTSVELSILFLLNIERGSLLSVLGFLNRLFVSLTPHESLISNYGSHIISNIFLAVVNDSNRSFTVSFTDFLFSWFEKYSNQANQLVFNCFRQATWLPTDTTFEERERLVKIILGLLNNKAKLKSILSDISQVCNKQMTWDVFLSYEL
eukprot:gene811-1013_t